ncbi:MAG: TonB-dependent receptor [Novosphingobium sp.]|nr:TonB-dependent receptor [Novosphingobium sp.]MCP5403013.1 TonB-dependent receptor [Novosphingobium sp.]
MAMPAASRAQQKSTENAVTSADDAFGTSVGLESTGIYSQHNVRGFSPLDAGNARIDGIYFDPVSLITLRARASQTMRVGFAALDYPFPAPTGIVDNRLRTVGNDLSVGLEMHKQQYGSYVGIVDAQIPVIRDRLGVVAGVSHGNAVFVDGATEANYSFAFKPVLRFEGVEFSPFYSANYVRDAEARTVTVSAGPFIPRLPKAKRYFGSFWAKNNRDNVNYGATLKARLTGRLSLRAGLFKSTLLRKDNFTEIFALPEAGADADHIVIADPRQNLHSWSGEVQGVYRFGTGGWEHRLIAGFRGRDRYTESGGSDILDLGQVPYGVRDTDLEPDFAFSAVNRGKVRQTSWLAGYFGQIDGVGRINLGLQRASFRARFVDADGTTRTRENVWLYNASLGLEITPHLMIYGGTQRGLEDSGAAPETAANRNEQLTAARSTQYEAGVHWDFGPGQLVVSAFEISKPYFSFDADRRYTLLGTVRHRGVEASLSGNFLNERLYLLVGGLVMKPEVSGPGREQGVVGRRPVGTRPEQFRLDANYRTDLWGGFTPTLSVSYFSKTAAMSSPLEGTDGRQLMLAGRSSVDIGARQPLRLGRYPATFRFKVENVLDTARWLVVASNTFFPADRRRISASLLVDF